MLSSAHIVPHSPILIPSIGKTNTVMVEKTAKAYQIIEDEIKEKEIDTLIVISPHGDVEKNSFVVTTSPELNIDLSHFGDLSSSLKFKGNFVLAQKIKEHIKSIYNVQLSGKDKLDYGSGIPIFMLQDSLVNTKIIIISVSELGLKENFEFGKLLKKEIDESNEKIAVIASGDLSHRLKKNTPEYSPKGAKFDSKLIEILKGDNSAKNILDLDEKLIEEAKECGLKSIIMLLGIMNNINYEPDLLAYQTDLGIGYLTMRFNF